MQLYIGYIQGKFCNFDENRIEQCFAAYIAGSFLQNCSVLLQLIQTQQYRPILLRTMNNV